MEGKSTGRHHVGEVRQHGIPFHGVGSDRRLPERHLHGEAAGHLDGCGRRRVRLTYDGTKYAVTDNALVLPSNELPASIEVSLSSDNMPMVITDTITRSI